MDLGNPVEAAAYLSAMIDGEGGVYNYAQGPFVRMTMTDIEPLLSARECCQTLAIQSGEMRTLNRLTVTGRPVYILEIRRQEALVRTAAALDLRHVAKRATLEAIRERCIERLIERDSGKRCVACGKREKPQRRGLCNRCRQRRVRGLVR